MLVCWCMSCANKLHKLLNEKCNCNVPIRKLTIMFSLDENLLHCRTWYVLTPRQWEETQNCKHNSPFYNYLNRRGNKLIIIQLYTYSDSNNTNIFLIDIIIHSLYNNILKLINYHDQILYSMSMRLLHLNHNKLRMYYKWNILRLSRLIPPKTVLS